jgi:hypothetical protein
MLGFYEQEGMSGVEQSSKGTVGSYPETLGYSSLTRIPKPSKNTIKNLSIPRIIIKCHKIFHIFMSFNI